MNSFRATLPTFAKKYVWEMKYGVLGYPKWIAPEDTVRYLSRSLSTNASILDLGCGRGSLLRALRDTGWVGNYCGVDISEWAISEARKIYDQCSSWAVSDFDSFRSPFKWDTITMIESIYCVKLTELPAFLERAIGMLNKRGFLLFRLHDLEKYRDYLETVCRLHPQTEKIAKNLFQLSFPVSL